MEEGGGGAVECGGGKREKSLITSVILDHDRKSKVTESSHLASVPPLLRPFVTVCINGVDPAPVRPYHLVSEPVTNHTS